eukprot:3893039-Amphidinium_carterae.1
MVNWDGDPRSACLMPIEFIVMHETARVHWHASHTGPRTRLDPLLRLSILKHNQQRWSIV